MSNETQEVGNADLAKLYPSMTADGKAEGGKADDWLARLVQDTREPTPPAHTDTEAKKTGETADKKAAAPSLEQTTQAIHSAAKELGIDAGELPQELSAFMHENRLDAKSMKGLVEMHNGQIEKMQEAAVAQWQAEASSIPKADLSTAVSVVRQFDEDSSFRDFLNETGLGNHPQLIRFLAKVGKQRGGQ